MLAQVYITLISLAIFVIPAVIIAVCYALIVNVIWRQSSSIMSSPAAVPTTRRHRTATKTSSSTWGNIYIRHQSCQVFVLLEILHEVKCMNIMKLVTCGKNITLLFIDYLMRGGIVHIFGPLEVEVN